MKNALINLKKNSQEKQIKYNELQLKELILNNINLLNIKEIAKEYDYEEGNPDEISFLGIDEDERLVIFEFKMGKMTRTINNAFMQNDYIKNHISQFKMLINDKYNKEFNNINYDARIIVFGEHFHKYDYESIRLLPYMVDLIQVSLFKDYLIFNKIYSSRNSNLNLKDIEPKYLELFKELRNYMFDLGEEVVESKNNGFISYRRINNFAFVYFDEGIHLCINNKNIVIKSYNDLEKNYGAIEKAYDEN